MLLGGVVSIVFAIVIASVGLIINEIPLVALGAFIILLAAFLLKFVETRITTIAMEGTITIEYKRLVGSKRWVRQFNHSDVRKIDYLKGYEGTETVFFGDRWCTLYLDVVFDEQIEIGKQYMANWSWNKFGFPMVARSIPLDAEAALIGNFLKVPVNTISYVDARDIGNSIYIPHDTMRPLLQRPTQEQLDHERDFEKPPK